MAHGTKRNQSRRDCCWAAEPLASSRHRLTTTIRPVATRLGCTKDSVRDRKMILSSDSDYTQSDMPNVNPVSAKLVDGRLLLRLDSGMAGAVDIVSPDLLAMRYASDGRSQVSLPIFATGDQTQTTVRVGDAEARIELPSGLSRIVYCPAAYDWPRSGPATGTILLLAALFVGSVVLTQLIPRRQTFWAMLLICIWSATLAAWLTLRPAVVSSVHRSATTDAIADESLRVFTAIRDTPVRLEVSPTDLRPASAEHLRAIEPVVLLRADGTPEGLMLRLRRGQQMAVRPAD